MKIHATSCAGPGGSTRKFEQLRGLHAASSPQLHQWTGDPAAADLIFLTDAPLAGTGDLTRHAYPRRYPEKCFVLSEEDQPDYLLAGIYPSTPRTPFAGGRFRTGSYALHHPDFQNPFVAAHDSSAPRQPDLLASFLGRNCHPARARLLALAPQPGLHLEDTSSYNAFVHQLPGREAAQRRFYEISVRSKFILCPRGACPSSIRLFEALRLGIAPVIMADAWIPCEGPRWEEFALFVPEKDTARLPAILARAEPTYARRGQLAYDAYRAWFAPESYFNYLVAAADSARRARIVPERWFVSLWPVARLLRRAHRRGRRLFRAR